MMLTFSLHCDEHVQQIQDTLSSWCSKLRFPYKKSGVVHLRRKKENVATSTSNFTRKCFSAVRTLILRRNIT